MALTIVSAGKSMILHVVIAHALEVFAIVEVDVLGLCKEVALEVLSALQIFVEVHEVFLILNEVGVGLCA